MSDEESGNAKPAVAQTTRTEQIRSADAPTLFKVLKALNTICGVLLICAGVQAFTVIATKDDDTDTDLSMTFSALYIITFSLLLIVFELHCNKKLDVYLFTYFGFMYSIFGRFLFFLFIGTLGFGLDTVFGYIVGGVTIAIVIFNAWVIRNNGEYLEILRQKNIASRLEAEQNTVAKTQGVEMEDKGGVKTAKAPSGDDWERVYDDEADSYYYYNKKTKETRWDQSNL